MRRAPCWSSWAFWRSCSNIVQPANAIGAASSVPEPSRRISGFGSSTGFAALGRGMQRVQAHPREDQRTQRSTRCDRTPPVARPLVGYISNGVTLADPFSVPGSASASPATVSTTAPEAENRPFSPSS